MSHKSPQYHIWDISLVGSSYICCICTCNLQNLDPTGTDVNFDGHESTLSLSQMLSISQFLLGGFVRVLGRLTLGVRLVGLSHCSSFLTWLLNCCLPIVLLRAPTGGTLPNLEASQVCHNYGIATLRFSACSCVSFEQICSHRCSELWVCVILCVCVCVFITTERICRRF